jgi:hypothetical protein
VDLPNGYVVHTQISRSTKELVCLYFFLVHSNSPSLTDGGEWGWRRSIGGWLYRGSKEIFIPLHQGEMPPVRVGVREGVGDQVINVSVR